MAMMIKKGVNAEQKGTRPTKKEGKEHDQPKKGGD